jgi:hypothetical protein
LSAVVQVAGNEAMSLALTERGYQLRWPGRLGDGLERGFYEGPPASCAVERLVGVSLEPQAIVSLALGGAPMVSGESRVVGQHWDRTRGLEILDLETPDFLQHLYFAFLAGSWWFVETRVEVRDSGRWAWTVAHEHPHRRGKTVFAERTRIERPDGKGRAVTTVVWNHVAAVADSGPSQAEPGWEEGGWEEGEGEEPSEDSGPSGDVDPIPATFRLSRAGLPARGDLCSP